MTDRESAYSDTAPLSVTVQRDLRFDLLRGLGLWMITLDHIPHNVVAWLTLRNYGFCDAAEFFVFISGYLLGFIYAPIVRGGQFFAAWKRLWLRSWQMYVAHILLFLTFTAQIARTARRFDNPLYKDEFNVANFLANPDELIGKALMLQYKPVNLDVLPLYILLIFASPAILWCMVRRPNWTLAASALLYVLARGLHWNLPSYPAGTTWYFNPFAWQLLFVFAAWCGVGCIDRFKPLIQSRVVFWIAVAWLVFALFMVMTWQSEYLESLVPRWLGPLIYPIDKTNLDIMRLTHFLAIAVVASRFLKPDWPALKSRWLRPLILCGQHSLVLFCLGVFISFGAHRILMQYDDGVLGQLAVSFAAIAITVAIAWMLDRTSRVPNLFVDVSWRAARPLP
jgi:hypothetical protein